MRRSGVPGKPVAGLADGGPQPEVRSNDLVLTTVVEAVNRRRAIVDVDPAVPLPGRARMPVSAGTLAESGVLVLPLHRADDRLGHLPEVARRLRHAFGSVA